MLVQVFGVSASKTLALRGEASLNICHDHFNEITDDDLIAFAVARSERREKTAKAKVMAETHLLAETTRSKRRLNEAGQPCPLDE